MRLGLPDYLDAAGSHTVLVLLEHDFKVVILDNLDNSFQKAFDRMVELAGDKAGNMSFVKVRGTAGGPGGGCGGGRQRRDQQTGGTGGIAVLS